MPGRTARSPRDARGNTVIAVAPFDPDADDVLDLRLAAGGFVVKFWNRGVLATTVGWLRAHGYGIVEVDATGSTATVELLDRIAEKLSFPSYFGRNLDAFNDCMRDVVAGEYGADLADTGLVLVFHGYDAFAAHEPGAAHAVLDIVALNARSAMLFGRRLLCLVQTDDPALEFPPIGATPVEWNGAEWASADRGV